LEHLERKRPRQTLISAKLQKAAAMPQKVCSSPFFYQAGAGDASSVFICEKNKKFICILSSSVLCYLYNIIYKEGGF
jgi:hypothetical protein